MNSVKIERVKLLDIVRENKEKHISQFDESVKDFIAAAKVIVAVNTLLVKSGDLNEIVKFSTLPPKPVSYENSYTRAIRMLELSCEDVIEIEEDVFNQLVLDEWSWKSNFSMNSTLYKAFIW